MADSQRKSYNLFDKNATDTSNGYEANHYLDGNGDSGASSNHNISEYIDISQYSTITISGADTSSYSIQNTFYNANKEKISHFPCNTMPKTVTVPNNAKYIRLTITKSRANEIMLISGSTPKPYEAYGAWVHSLRKLTTATEAVENPLYSDGTAITAYTLKGNTVQSGTPTPANPVDVNGVGEMSANLVSMSEPQGDGYLANSVVGITNDGREQIISTTSFFVTEYIPVSEGTYYYYSDLYRATGANAKFMFYNANKEYIGFTDRQPAMEEQPVYELSSFSVPNGAAYVRMNIDKSSTKNCLYTSQLPSYEPYGQYKIPISSGGVTTNIYLSEPLYKIGDYADTIAADGTVTRKIKKLVLTGEGSGWTDRPNYNYADRFVLQTSTIPNNSQLICTHFPVVYSSEQTYPYVWNNNGEQLIINYSEKGTTTLAQFLQFLATQYANGTPVTVYYVLATPTTETVTAPSIPTTEGANSITVDTTVQPSEFTATWTGWHNASVQEYDGSDWQ